LGREELILMDAEEARRSTVFLRDFLAAPGNREAFGKFVAKYQPRIKRCCERGGLQDADADDLTASILLGFLERDVFSRFVFRGKERFYAWLNRAVKFAVLTFVRDRGRRPGFSSVGNADAQASLEAVAEGLVRDLGALCDEDYARVQAARVRVEGRVEEKTREAFRMLEDEACPVEEVVERLGMTKVAVWKARSRFLRMLREEFPDLHGPAGEE
jgi:DNA-directed RNA polymerase specialized sigma24 family protein